MNSRLGGTRRRSLVLGLTYRKTTPGAAALLPTPAHAASTAGARAALAGRAWSAEVSQSGLHGACC